MTLKLFLFIAVGACMGAFLRYFFSFKLNGVFPAIPFGTLLSNLLGAFIMGAVIHISLGFYVISKEVLIGVTTGFLGSLTTFSTFSAELFDLLVKREYLYGFLHMSLHLFGSLIMVFIGFALSKLCLLSLGKL